MDDEDRAAGMIPPHRGTNILPNSPLFAKLLRYAHRRPQRVVVRDVNAGVEKTHVQLLTDVLALRRVIETTLSPSVRDSLKTGEDVYMSILAPGGYEYTVAFLAILAVGAAAVPLSKWDPQSCDSQYAHDVSDCIARGGSVLLHTKISRGGRSHSLICSYLGPVIREIHQNINVPSSVLYTYRSIFMSLGSVTLQYSHLIRQIP